MMDNPEMIIHDAPEAVVIQEVPDNCDACGAGMKFLNPIKQERKTSFGRDWMVVGYICESCDSTCLYR